MSDYPRQRHRPLVPAFLVHLTFSAIESWLTLTQEETSFNVQGICAIVSAHAPTTGHDFERRQERNEGRYFALSMCAL
jgi:hypothetical protein